ncbi:MAG: betaine/proline/choline family ABC transporter ATP-binding protein [Pseudomonadota bacterium]
MIEKGADPVTSKPAIECRGVWKVFGVSRESFLQGGGRSLSDKELVERNWIVAVRDASFQIAPGEVFVIMGLSGSGKSTIVRCLSRLIEPTDGEVFVEGMNLLGASDAELIDVRRRKMGMVFQHFALLPNRNVVGNVAFPLQVQGIERKKREERAREMISLVGLDGREDYYPDELSGGQQQRVGIARSLASDPTLWFLDEPFSALDPLIRADLQDELLRLQEQLGKTIVFITHDLDEAIKIADRIAIMDQGLVVQIGSPEELVLNPANDYVARFTKNVPRAKVVRVGTIMRPAQASDRTDVVSFSPNDRVTDVASIIVNHEGPAAVREDNGPILGFVDREKLVAVLAGADTGN